MKRPEKSLPDTNTIVRYLVRDNEALYGRAKEFFDKIKIGTAKAVILESVMAECVYVLTKIYKVPRDRAAESLKDILHYKGIANNDREELIKALTLFATRNLDIVDCILCCKASKSDTTLFSFDEDLNKISIQHRNSRN